MSKLVELNMHELGKKFIKIMYISDDDIIQFAVIRRYHDYLTFIDHISLFYMHKRPVVTDKNIKKRLNKMEKQYDYESYQYNLNKYPKFTFFGRIHNKIKQSETLQIILLVTTIISLATIIGLLIGFIIKIISLGIR